MADRIRDGKGHRAYRRQALALRRRVQREDLTCARCGRTIDTTLPATHPESFTADHPEALARGGKLVGQNLEPMHRRCNASRGTGAPEVEIWEAS